LARRAGQLRTGFEKVREDLKTGRVAPVARGMRRRRRWAEKAGGLAGELPIIALFDSAELSAALGVEGVVHAGRAAGGMAGALLREFERFRYASEWLRGTIATEI